MASGWIRGYPASVDILHVRMETSDVIVTIQLTTVAMTVVMTLVRSQSVPIHDHILQEMHTMKVDG